jgi:hypothetical protein
MYPPCINPAKLLSHHGKATREECVLALEVLARLVRDEYGDRYTLVEVAGTWGEGVTPEQLKALAHLAPLLGEPSGEGVDDGCEHPEV